MDWNRHISKEYIKRANKHGGKWSTSLISEGMQVQANKGTIKKAVS